MKSIEIKNDKHKTVFTPRSVIIDGEEFAYTSVSEITHCAETCRYSIAADDRKASFTSNEKDAKALEVLFSRIAQLRGLEITEDTVPEIKEDAAPEVSSEPSGLLQRPVIIIVEAAVALALLAIGIYLLFFAF